MELLLLLLPVMLMPWQPYLWKAERRRMPLNINGRFIAVSHQYFSQCDWGHGDRALMKLATDGLP